MPPSVSVVIPMYNEEAYVERSVAAARSALEQMGGEWEIVLVDDASTDDPAEVVARVGRGFVGYRPNPGHLGAIGTFNRCVALARGGAGTVAGPTSPAGSGVPEPSCATD